MHPSIERGEPVREELRFSIDCEGFMVVQDVVERIAVEKLIAAMERILMSLNVSKRGLAAYSGRNLLRDVLEVRTLASSSPARRLVETVMGPGAFAVRALYFDKSPRANWMVDWHKDRTIAVREQRDLLGFRLWTMKAGVPHVQPPVRVLEKMLTLRVHLGDCGETNGALRVIPGSHRAGFIPDDEIDSCVRTHSAVTCVVPRGGVLVMRPLLLHASSRSTQGGHRRVIHLEFAAEELPRPLEWNERF